MSQYSKTSYALDPLEVDFFKRNKGSFTLVDLRSAAEYEKGHIPGAIHLPFDRWEYCDGLSPEELNVFYCYSAQTELAELAIDYFSQRGYSSIKMEGGFEAWANDDLEIERTHFYKIA